MQIQAEIVQLLLNLQAETKMSMFFISHVIVLVQGAVPASADNAIRRYHRKRYSTRDHYRATAGIY